MSKKKDDIEEILENQIPDVVDTDTESPSEETENDAASFLGKKLTHNIGKTNRSQIDTDNDFTKEHRLSRIGDNLNERADFRDGWMDVDRSLLQERDIFYPSSWRIRIKPAEVEAIRHWSTLDDENPNSVDDVFNEILKTCLQIVTPTGNLSWGHINAWDRFFFLLLVRSYTFKKGESAVEFEEECPNCEHEVKFTLDALNLMYDLPDKEVMKHYDAERRVWVIDPADYDMEGDVIELYVPTLEKDIAVKSWMISKLQQKKRIDDVFIRFVLWMAPKISRDSNIAEKQMKDYERKFKSMDKDMFSFVNSIIKNIMVTPSQQLIATCPNCGEEMTAPIQFQNGIAHLFALPNKFKKFGSK